MHNHDLDISKERIEEIVNNQNVRRATTRACHHWFFHIYFSHYTKYRTAPFQRELFELTEDTSHKNLVIEAFRGSGKTTIMGTSYTIWSILGVQQKKFVLIIAKTESQAKQYLANIKLELESNRLLRMDLGPFEEPNDEWRAVSIVLPKYNARVMVASIENSIRGIKHGAHRPDLIICDDLEDLDTVRSAESRKKMFDWLTGDIIPLGDKTTRLIVIGTKLHNDSIIVKLKQNIFEEKMDGVAKAYPFLDNDGNALWNDKYPTYADIQTLRKSVPSLQAWEREYMLNIVSDDTQLVRPEWIQYYDQLPSSDQLRYSALGVDPAIGKNSDNDSTAIVSGKVYGRKKAMKIYVLPNAINEKMDFTETIAKVKSLSDNLSNGSTMHMWIESVAYQKAIVDQLRSDGYPAKEWKTGGNDKRARLSLVSSHIQSGMVLFPKYGAEKLITQLTGFGTETHDDLCDALGVLVLSIIDQESKVIKGHIELFSEQMLSNSFSEKIPFMGEKRLGVILADRYRSYSTIVIRAENAAEILFHEMIDDPLTIALKTIELAKIHNVPLSDQNIFVDKAGRGMELCKLISAYAVGQFLIGKYGNRQKYGLDLTEPYQYNDGMYDDLYAAGYSKLAKWLRNGGKLIGRGKFDDLLHIVYVEHNGKMKMVDKDELFEQGIDPSIPDALALTTTKDKRVIERPHEDDFLSHDVFDMDYDLPPQYPDIGIW